MNALEQRLGMSTAWTRFRSAAASRAFEARLDLLRVRVEDLNLDEDAVHLAAEIAALEPDLGDDDRCALIVLILCSLASIQEGSTRLPLPAADGDRALDRLLEPLCGGPDGAPEKAQTLARIETILRTGAASSVIGASANDYKPLLHLDSCIYHQRSHFTESRLAKRLFSFVRGAPDPFVLDPDAALREVLEGPSRLAFTEDQKAAVREACRSSLTIVTGGPGTGKTSIVVAILRVLARLGVDPARVALAAPTGKAADRMGESIRAGMDGAARMTPEEEAFRSLAPVTLHRLLGYLPRQNRFLHHASNPLDQLFVIVDEGSMVDLELMDRLVATLRPGTRLVLLGDANQLPSVSAGAVFRDLLPEAWSGQGAATLETGVPCVRLMHSFRMDAGDPAGRSIFLVSESINRGETAVFGEAPDGTPLIVPRDNVDDLAWSGVELVDPGAGRLVGFLDRWDALCGVADPVIRELAEKVYHTDSSGFDPRALGDLSALFERLGRARLLCVTRVFSTGSVEINRRLHARAAQRARKHPDRFPFLPGEPIMMLHNDYTLSLWNGDQGVVLRVSVNGSKDELRAVFPREGGFGVYHLEVLRGSLEHSYAMTVHKAQGSEFDGVGVLLPEKDIPLLTREILYTAITRSRKSVVTIGSRDLIVRAIGRKIERSSGLSEKLRALLVAERNPPTRPRSASKKPRRTSGSGSRARGGS